MPTFDARTKRNLTLLILVLGLALRLTWVGFRGLSRDELTSLGYVLAPEWQSIFWDNAPPTFYAVMKGLYALVATEGVLRAFAFVASATSFVVFFRFLQKESSGNLWLLSFWALSPTSVVNATFRPTVFAELAGILFFLELRTGSLFRILVSLGALAASTYLAFLAPLVALSEVDFRDRKKVVALGVGLALVAIGVTRINWPALSWLSADEPLELAKSSFLMLSQLWGFSLPLFLAVTWILISNREVPRSFIVIVALILIGPLVTGHKFSSSRFLIVFTPWVLMSISAVLRIRRDVLAGAVIVVIPAITTSWFLMHEKSGWKEAGAFVASTGAPAMFYAPAPLAWYFSPKYSSAEVDMDASIVRHIRDGGWILRANPSRDKRMSEFLKNGGNPAYVLVESKVFGEGSLEPVSAVRIAPRPVK